MPVTPAFTLTATLQTIVGAAAGSAPNPAKLVIRLRGYYLRLPCVAGTSNIAQTRYEQLFSAAGQVAIVLWGNDQLTPVIPAAGGGTFYEITVVDGYGNVVQTGMYQFVGTGPIDLSVATPYVPNPPAPPAPTPVSGLQYLPCVPPAPQAAATVYTAPGPVIVPYYNGSPLLPGSYTTISATTFSLPFATYDGDQVNALCNMASSPLTLGACTPAAPQGSGTVYTAPGGAVKVVQVLYNGSAQANNGVAYTVLTATTFRLNFATFSGDTVDVFYTT